MFRNFFIALLITTLLMGLGGIFATGKINKSIQEGGIHFEKED